MAFKNIITYILIMALIAVTLFNIYATATAKRRRKNAFQSYHAAMQPVEDKLLKHMKEFGLNYNKVKRLMTNNDEAVILAYDEKNDSGAIAMADDVLYFKKAELKSVEKAYTAEEHGKHVLKAEIKIGYNDTLYTYTMADKPFNPKGMMGKVISETVESFYDFINDIIKA